MEQKTPPRAGRGLRRPRKWKVPRVLYPRYEASTLRMKFNLPFLTIST